MTLAYLFCWLWPAFSSALGCASVARSRPPLTDGGVGAGDGAAARSESASDGVEEGRDVAEEEELEDVVEAGAAADKSFVINPAILLLDSCDSDTICCNKFVEMAGAEAPFWLG